MSQKSYVTEDGGRSWRSCELERNYNEQHPGDTTYFLTPTLGWAITSRTVDHKTIYGVARSVDSGCNWQQLWISEANPDEMYSDIYFLNEREGWLSGKANGSLYHTIDGGKTWEQISLPEEHAKVTNVYFVDSREGWIIVKRMGRDDQEGLYHTIDSGRTWRNLRRRELIGSPSAKSSGSQIPTQWKAGQLLRMLFRRNA